MTYLILYLGAAYMEMGRDKKREGTIFFVSPLYGDFFNRDGITRQDGIISVPPFRIPIP